MRSTTQLPVIFVCGAVVCSFCFGGVIYVDADAPGGNGSSWADAFNELQSALASATYGDEIRTAEGNYRPDYNAGSPAHTGDRRATFLLPEGVTVKGGYAGLGTADPNARDVGLYETILSGDLNGNDGPNFVNKSENSYHVVTGSARDRSAVIDGFTITGGNADGTAPEDCGGGMYNFAGSPTVRNCTFLGDYAMTMGGGMFNREGSCPEITNCDFIGNKSDDDGGGIRNYLNCHAVIDNCRFIENVAFEDGGGINNRKNSNASITNCVFIGNIARCGGGMENHVGRATPTGEPLIVNCIFAGNVGVEGGGMRNNDPNPTVVNCTFADNIGSGMRNDTGSVPAVGNCILWGNTCGSFDGSNVPVVKYSDVQGGFAGEDNLDIDPLFADSGGGDYHLKSQAGRWDENSQAWVQDDVTSPCIDAGDPNSNWTAELWPHGKRMDMGAYGGVSQASMSLSQTGSVADLDHNDRVDFSDLIILTRQWLRVEPLLAEDLNRDNIVDLQDFTMMSAHWLDGDGN